MEIIQIKGSAAEAKLNGSGNAIVMVSNRGVDELIYLRDIIEGWQDDAPNWKRTAKHHPVAIATENRLRENGTVYLGSILIDHFVATW